MSQSIKKILVGIDLSSYSGETLQVAGEMADNLSVPLIVANIIHQRDVDAFTRYAEKSPLLLWGLSKASRSGPCGPYQEIDRAGPVRQSLHHDDIWYGCPFSGIDPHGS